MMKYALLFLCALFAPVATAQETDFGDVNFATLYDDLQAAPGELTLMIEGLTEAEADILIVTRVRTAEQLEKFLAIARGGYRKAQRQLAIECLVEARCPVTRKEAHDLLISAARSDMYSAVTVANIYRNGQWGAQPYPVDAAKWYLHAGKLGYELVGLQLATLPREAVIEAGGESYLIPEPAANMPLTREAALEPIEQPSLMGLTMMPVDSGPFIVRTRDGRELRVGVKTSFSDIGDASASCYVAIWYDLMPFADKVEARANGLPAANLIPLMPDALFEKASSREQIIMKVAYRDMADHQVNGGLRMMDDVSANFRTHADLLMKDPSRLPTRADCERLYLSYGGFAKQQK